MRFYAPSLANGLLLALVLGCNSDRDLKRAEALLSGGRPEEAIRVLDKSLPGLRDQAEAAQGYTLLGDALVRIGRVTEAFTVYEKASALDPANHRPVQKMAELLVATGNSERGVSVAQRLFALRPDDPDALSLYGSALAGAGRRPEAEQALRKALALRPSHADAAISLAELMLRDDRVEEAREILQSTSTQAKDPAAVLALARLEEQAGNPDAAEDAYRRAVHLQDSVDTNFRLAQYLQRAAKIEEAVNVLHHLDELDQQIASKADFDLAQRGRATSALQSYAKALKRLTGDTGVDPERLRFACKTIEAALQAEGVPLEVRIRNAQLLLNQHRADLDLGTTSLLQTEIALASGDLASADQRSALALEYLPDSASAHYLRGVVLDRSGDNLRALQEWQTAAGSDHTPSRLMLAAHSIRNGELSIAEENAAAVLRDEPANLAALLIYAKALSQHGQLDAADSIVRRALAVDPTSAEAYVISGSIALRRRADAAALIAFEKALIFDRWSSEAVNGLLQVFANGKPRREAITKLEKMADAPPRSATLFEVAGRLYEMVGAKTDAGRALRRALDVDADRPSAQLALWQVNRGKPDPTAETTLDTPNAELLQAYEREVRRGDPSGVASNNLALVYATGGQRLERALELAVHAVNRVPNRPEPMDTLGMVLLKMRRYTAASQAFERALELKPQGEARRQITLHLADAYDASGLTDKADALRSSVKRVRG
jgi:tetratricopeptide (TPR) repeat protein